MNPTKTTPTTRVALALGLAAGALLIPAATMAGNTLISGPGQSMLVPVEFKVGHAPPSAKTDEDAAQGDAAEGDSASSSEDDTMTPVSFTRDQADRGKDKFEADCVECHGENLKGGLNGGAPLRGTSFDDKYAKGAPASWLFEFMSNQMPPNSPGRFSASTYADLMAYILQENGFQPGAELPSDLDALDQLAMTK